MSLESRIQDAIQLLPDEPDEIAIFLYEQGLRGRKIRANDCPIARYIRRSLLPEEKICLSVSVSPSGYSVIESNGTTIAADGNFSENVCSFIQEFDTGRYPLLEEESYPTFMHTP